MILPDLRVFISSPIPKNEDSKIREILQKYRNTVTLECTFKTVELLFKSHQNPKNNNFR